MPMQRDCCSDETAFTSIDFSPDPTLDCYCWDGSRELGVYGGVSLGDGYHHGRVLALAGVRRYVSRTIAIALSAGAEYDFASLDGDHVHALIDLALWL